MTVARQIPPATDAPPATQVTLRDIGGRLQTLEDARASDLTAQTATDKGQAATLQSLSRQISDLSVVVTALTNQTSYGFNSNQFVASNQNGTNVYGFDGTYDISISLTTTASGKLWVTPAAQLSVTGTGGPFLTYEILWAGGSYMPTQYEVPAFLVSAPNTAIMASNTSRSSLATVPANTAVTIRTRRGYRNNNPHTGTFGYEAQSLSVTKIY